MPKKPKNEVRMEPCDADSSLVDESVLYRRASKPTINDKISVYLPIVMRTSPNAVSRSDLILMEKIRARILDEVRQYNTPNISKDIRLWTLNSESLWLDEFW